MASTAAAPDAGSDVQAAAPAVPSIASLRDTFSLLPDLRYLFEILEKDPDNAGVAIGKVRRKLAECRSICEQLRSTHNLSADLDAELREKQALLAERRAVLDQCLALPIFHTPQ